jgi:hypothetical protein
MIYSRCYAPRCVEQSLRLLEVGGIEALREPASRFPQTSRLRHKLESGLRAEEICDLDAACQRAQEA